MRPAAAPVQLASPEYEVLGPSRPAAGLDYDRREPHGKRLALSSDVTSAPLGQAEDHSVPAGPEPAPRGREPDPSRGTARRQPAADGAHSRARHWNEQPPGAQRHPLRQAPDLGGSPAGARLLVGTAAPRC